ncbi:porin [Melioribacter sp. OK-6-Me]|uniref:porin n=1 Tax=unclassified Melioribacter TaxID=2627329 RepID=UPI003EDB1EBB
MKNKIILFLFIAVTIAAQNKSESSMKFFGYVRSWYETDFSENHGEFKVKMARFGFKGDVNQYTGYRLLVDFARLGKLKTTYTNIDGKSVVSSVSASFSDVLLDAQAILKPTKNFTLSLGQYKVPFSTDNLKSAADIEFVNRPLLTSVAPGLRDVGVMAEYKFSSNVPLMLSAGLFNGSGQNKSETDNTANYSIRAVTEIIDGVELSANYYGGRLDNEDVNIFDLGAAFEYNNFTLNGEFGQRNTDLSSYSITSNAFFVYGVYSIKLDNSILSYIMPAIRYEYYEPNNSIDSNEIEKITGGISFHFAKINFAQLRINYEIYNYKDGRDNPNILFIELQTRF